ncbi:hypothetical protein DYB32_006451 [Aphanomyces invadans]|uniref:ORC1/DEAH AAA+ ATPase domain-containing protein n=1 Tax=Aphanomyces invadans TaxID=157072 RepID=A0A3R6YWP4_9STRA|nr:hypothetical protein DYB32_006451 [Aphanomyces invadans]
MDRVDARSAAAGCIVRARTHTRPIVAHAVSHVGNVRLLLRNGQDTSLSGCRRGVLGRMKKGGHKAAVAAMDNITSISEFESEFHHAFIKSRLDHNDYVYKTALLRDLDEFCDVDSMHVPKGPLIVFGEPGSGKSAFLANWINRRKKKFQNWNNGFPEFIFYHAVGCTRQGAFVSKLLERILTEMNEYFELTKEVPTFEERLSWQFPRYLEAASRKGRTILIVDGVHRLRTSDGDSILKWLPLSVRRNWTTVYINPFTDDEKQLAVQKFLSRQTGQATLQLFELQQKANNPSLSRPPISHSVLHEWLGVATMSELFEVILRSMEAGHTPTTAATSDAMLFLQEHSLDATFAWVPQSTKPPQSGSQQGLAAFASARSKQQVNSPGQTAQPSHRLSETSVAEFVKSTRRPSTVGGDDGMGSPRYQDETNTDVHLAYCELFDTEISNSGASGGVGGFGGDELIASDAPRQVRTSVLAPMADKSSDPADEVQGGNGATDSHDRRIDSGSNDEGADQNHHPSPSVQLPATTQTAVPRSPPPPFLRHLERVKTHRNIVFPVYVTGGLPVDGLGGLLGKALCVLYVARHGLLLHELRTLVQAMAAHEARIAPLDAPEVQTPADDDDGTNLAAILNDYKPARPKVPALPDTTWSTLLSALKALGCLFLQDIVLLPLCYDTLRDLVRTPRRRRTSL